MLLDGSAAIGPWLRLVLGSHFRSLHAGSIICCRHYPPIFPSNPHPTLTHLLRRVADELVVGYVSRHHEVRRPRGVARKRALLPRQNAHLLNHQTRATRPSRTVGARVAASAVGPEGSVGAAVVDGAAEWVEVEGGS